MKYFLSFLLVLCMGLHAIAQKKVDAVVNLVDSKLDSVIIKKGRSFVVQLPVHNRNGDDWKLAEPVVKCEFTESMLGQAGMLPNQPEPKLMFFKAIEKGLDTIKFVYKNPRLAAGSEPELRILKVTIQ